jgi:hypothetical protein
MAKDAGGIYRFGPAMSSVVLATCRPERFTVADSRALSTLRRLGRMPPGAPTFRLDDWLPYLMPAPELGSAVSSQLASDRPGTVDRGQPYAFAG